MTPALELWGGVECTYNRVGDRINDQLALTGHADRLDDLSRLADLGLRTLRVALPWERIQTAPDVYDWLWADAMMDRLRGLGVKPIVGLVHHGCGPAWADFTTHEFSARLAAYAARIARRYPWVTDWTPVNEPLTTARFSCLYGIWQPHLTDETAFWNALLIQIEATAAAMREVRAIVPHARLIQTEDGGRTHATDPCGAQATFENERRLMTFDLLFGRVRPGHPLYPRLAGLGLGDRLDHLARTPSSPDVVGLNYYVTSDRFLDHRLALYPPCLHGGSDQMAYADAESVRALVDWTLGWGRDLRCLHERYGRPVAVTECHLGCDPVQQAAWLSQCWRAAQAARDDGVPVEAVTAWALAGSVGWDRLLTAKTGSYEPGIIDAGGSISPDHPLANLVHRLTSGAEPGPAGVAGWWDQPDRLIFPLGGPVTETLVA